MKNKKGQLLRLCMIIVISGIVSCAGYQNPGNNSGKTGDGTKTDSLRSPKSDTGKGANLRNKALERAKDSVKKKKTF